MIYIVIVIFLIAIIGKSLGAIKSFLASVFTLSFLPNAIGMFDGNINTIASNIPVISEVVEGIVNWLSVIFINVIDFFLWFIYWIPGVKQIIQIIYTAPDLVERLVSSILGSHRNFITHSIFNPIFLIFIIITFIVCRILNQFEIGEFISSLLMLIGFTFACHLLADTMPQSWVGFANIKVQIFITFFVMPPWLGKLWLIGNAILCIGVTTKATLGDKL